MKKVRSDTFIAHIKKGTHERVMDQLRLEELAKELPIRKSRAKRHFSRLRIKVRKDNKYSKVLLNTYYKLSLSRQTSKQTPQTNKRVYTRLGNLFVLPYMVRKDVGVYNGKKYELLKIRQNMIGRYLGQFVRTRAPVSHGKQGINVSKMKR